MWTIKERFVSFIGVIMVIAGLLGVTGCGDNKDVLKDRIEITSEQRQDLNKLIEDKNYKQLALETVRNKNNNIELNAMYYFASAMESFYGDGNMMNYYFEQIPEQYREHYHSLYEEEVDNYITKLQKEIDDEKVEYKDLPPAIGENREQLKTSSWGLPYDINKTTTGDNVSEQWVYGDGKYVYLDNGIVSAIQE